MKPYLLTAPFALVALLAAPASAQQQPFGDVPKEHWASDAITALSSRGVFTGYPDSTFRGRRAVTRYEGAQALSRARLEIMRLMAARPASGIPGPPGPPGPRGPLGPRGPRGPAGPPAARVSEELRGLAQEQEATRRDLEGVRRQFEESRLQLRALRESVAELRRQTEMLGERADTVRRSKSPFRK